MVRIFVLLASLFLACSGVAQATDLSSRAGALSPGGWVQMPAPPSGFFRQSGVVSDTTLQFMGEGAWSNSRKEIIFWGGAHFGNTKLHIYSDSGNTWFEGANTPNFPEQWAHGYNHNGYNQATNELGAIWMSGSNTINVRRYSRNSNTWASTGTISNDGEIAAAIEYFPERGSWIIADGTFGRVRELDINNPSDSTIVTNSACFGGSILSINHTFATYLPQRAEVAYGGGNNSAGNIFFSRKWCTINASGTVTVRPEAPHTLRIPEGGNNTRGSLITVDPASGDLIILTQVGTMHRFSFSSNSWAQVSTSIPGLFNQSSNAVTNGFVVPIPTYGVIAYGKHTGSGSAQWWLYKHSGSTAPVDTTPPTTPTGVTGFGASDTSITLSWSASSDNVGVASYNIQLDGSPSGTTSQTGITITGLTAETAYAVTVQAADAAGNTSSFSSSVSVSTLEPIAPPVITSPTPGVTLVSDSQLFTWDANGGPVVEWWLDVGSTVGAFDLHISQSLGTATSHTVTGLPQDGRTLFVRLYYRTVVGGWLSHDFQYTASTAAVDVTAPTIPSQLATTSVSSSQIALSWTASTDSVGVTGYRVYLNGTSLTTTTSTAYTHSGLSSETIYRYTVSAFDAAGNASGQSSQLSVQTLAGGTGQPNEANTVTIHDASGSTQTNRPHSVARPFPIGEISQCVLASIGNTSLLTQTDVKNRWADGSLKYAVVSFVLPSIPANGSVTVAFSNQAACNNSGHLQQGDMLSAGYNFNTTMSLTGAASRTVNARSMLSNGAWRYWLQGPIVTAVIIEDREGRAYDIDMGDGSNSLHPIIEAWFYPQGQDVRVGAALENVWVSNTSGNGSRDQTYAVSIRSGNTGSVAEYSHATFTHHGQSRWHQRFWNQTGPGALRTDHNLAYLVGTRAIPHYDASLSVSASLESQQYSTFQSYNDIAGVQTGGTIRLGNITNLLDNAGVNSWIGLQKTWEVLWLHSMSQIGYEMTLGNADLAGRLPIHLREADAQAGTGDFFDQTWSLRPNLTSQGSNLGTGSIGTLGRIPSINARPSSTFSSYFDSQAQDGDKIRRQGVGNGGWVQLDSSHYSDPCYTAYLFSGRYYYLECMQMEANWRLGFKLSGWNQNYTRAGEAGWVNHTNIRGDAWGLKTINYAAFLSPDGTPEQAYFREKVLNHIVMYEGVQDIPNTVPAKQEYWNWGRFVRTTNTYWAFPGGRVSPLGAWSTGVAAFIQAPLVGGNGLTHATSPWEENFMLCVLGMVEQMQVADASKLLQHMAKLRFHINLDPVPANLNNFIEAYRVPTMVNNDWISNMADWRNRFSTSLEPYTKRRDDLVTDHSYAFIALAADSFLEPYTVDGLTGVASFAANQADTPHQTRFESNSPKWAITPYRAPTGVVNPPPPPPPVVTPFPDPPISDPIGGHHFNPFGGGL